MPAVSDITQASALTALATRAYSKDFSIWDDTTVTLPLMSRLESSSGKRELWLLGKSAAGAC